MPHVRSQFSTSALWVNPLVSKPPDTQPDGRCEHQPREMCHHENVHMCHLHTSRGREPHSTPFLRPHRQGPFLHNTFITQSPHGSLSASQSPHRSLSASHSAGLCWALCPVWRLRPCCHNLFTTFITLTAYKSLKHYSRQVIPAAASYLREPRSGERHKGPVWLWNLGSCDRETG